MLKDSVKDILKIFLIFNIVNLMQFFIVSDPWIKNMFIINYVKTLNFRQYVEILKYGFNNVYWCSLLVLIAIYMLIYSISGKKKMSILFTIVLIYMCSILNYIVTDIRGNAFTIYDLLAVKTAINVTSNLEFTINNDFKIATVLFILAMILAVFLYKRKNKEKAKKKTRIIMPCLAVVVLIFVVNSSVVNDLAMWNINTTYADYGVILTWVKLMTALRVEKPEDYNISEVKAILDQYEYDEYNNENLDVNVIVIMNESFADYTKSENVELFEDNIPYFHSLQEADNVITGIMHSDTYGGGTANIEYEFLTQNTIAFLPVGSIAYQQYVTEGTDSIVSRMKELNYITYGIHTWNKSGYRRENVYRYLGFDYYMFKEDYDDLEYLANNYTKDKSSYEKIMEILEKKSEDDRIFSFNVTVQNHIPYSHVNTEAKKYAENRIMNIYFQTENESDTALEKLIEYLERYDQKIILLFFGDHQPNTGNEDIIKDEENKWKVPYLIWTNYDIDEVEYGETSAIYLQSILMEVAGLPKDSYTNYISELRTQIPILTANYYIGDDGVKYYYNDTSAPYYEKIQEYRKIVYYQMFDK